MKSRIFVFLVIFLFVIIVLFGAFNYIAASKQNQENSKIQNGNILYSFGNESFFLYGNNSGNSQEIILLLQKVADESDQDLDYYYYPHGPVIGHGYNNQGLIVQINKDWNVNESYIREIYSVIEWHGEQNGIKNIPCKFLSMGMLKMD